jgi:hypothetical protein
VVGVERHSIHISQDLAKTELFATVSGPYTPRPGYAVTR